jgi:hypothetical protein
MKKRAPLVLVAIGLVFLVIAYLLSRGSASQTGPDAGPEVAARKPVIYPRDDRRPKRPRGALAEAQVPAEKQKETLDAMQRALSPKDGKGALFVEVNAIRHTPLVEKILKCREAEMFDSLDTFKNELGIDPMEDLDRVGIMPDVVAASGFFENLKIPADLGEGDAYGKGARIYKAKGDEGEDLYLGKVGDSLVMTSSNEASLKAAIDRAEDPNAEVTTMPGELSKSELYGTMDGSLARELLAASDSPEARRMADTIASTTMRMNVDENVASSFDVVGRTPEEGEQLRKAVTAALALGRARATTEGETELAALLDQAVVQEQKDGGFGLDLAVPGDVLLRAMGCDANGNPGGARDDDDTGPSDGGAG